VSTLLWRLVSIILNIDAPLQRGTPDRRIGLAIADFRRAFVPGEITMLEMVRMSAIGTKRTSLFAPHMSAIGGKADMAWRNRINTTDPFILRLAVALTNAVTVNRAKGALEDAMISLEDCIAFSGLDKNEVEAISEHEHIPEIAAAALANYLLKQPNGGEAIRTMIIDDIHKALEAGRVKHAQELFMALRHFLDEHPEARAAVKV